MNKYGEGCRRVGLAFLHLQIKILGAWKESMVRQVKRMGSALSRHTENEGECIIYLSQRLDVLLTKNNAKIFLNRLPDFPIFEVDGND